MKRMEPSGTDCHHYLAPYEPGDPGATLSNSVLKSKNSQADRPGNSKTGPTFLFSCIYRMRSFWLVMMPEKSKCSRIPRFCLQGKGQKGQADPASFSRSRYSQHQRKYTICCFLKCQYQIR